MAVVAVVSWQTRGGVGEERRERREVSLTTECKDQVYAQGTRGQAPVLSENYLEIRVTPTFRVFPLISTDQQNRII